MSTPPTRTNTERAILKALEYTVTAFAGLLVIDVVAGVFWRYVLGSSLSWTDEFGGYMLAWLSFLGAALLFAEDGHISFELAINAMPYRWQRRVLCSGYVLSIIFFLVVAWQSLYLLADLRGSYAVAVEVPKSAIYSVVLICSVLATYLLAVRMITVWRRKG